MKNFKFLLLVVAVAMTLSGCSAIGNWLETGSISFVSPTPKYEIHEDPGEVQWIPVTINSSFKNPKLLNICVGSFCYQCNALPGNNVCDYAPVSDPGEHVIRAETFKQDGVTAVSIETVVKWRPWTKLDKAMQFLDEDNPLPGYGLIGFLIACIAAAVFGRIFGAQWGAILGFFLALIGLAYFFGQAGSTVMAGQVLTLIGSIIGASLFAVIVFNMIKNGYMVSTGSYASVRAGDKEVTMGSGPSLGPGDKVSTPEKMGESAAKLFPVPQGYRALPAETPPQITYEKRKRRLFGR